MFGRRSRVRTKLLFGLVVIGALVASTASVVILLQIVVRRSFAIHDRMVTIEIALLECRRGEKNFFLREDLPSAEMFAGSLQSLVDEVRSLRSEVGGTDSVELLAQLEDVVVSYGEQFTQTSSRLWADADVRERDRLMGATVDAAHACHDAVDRVTAVAVSRLGSAARTTQRISLLTVTLGFFLALLVCWWLTRTIVNPLEQLRVLAERVSSGDIQDMDVEFGDLEVERFGTREAYDLALTLQKMVTNMRLLVSTERGLMDHYHMTIMVLAHRAVGPASWSIIERARIAAGLSSFSEVNPDNVHRFVAALETGLRPLIHEDSVRLLVSAISELNV